MASKRELELLLSARGLATAGARPSASAEYGRADALARLWREGPPAHAITELVPDEPAGRNAGLTSLGCRMAALACLGEDARIAWADPQDQWDPASAQAAGVRLEKVLWLRGTRAVARMTGLSRWHEALGLLIQAGGMDLVVADFSSWPKNELRRIPRSAWFRLLRGLERSQRTALLLLAPEPHTQACAAWVIGVGYGAAQWPRESLQRLRGVPVQGRLLRQRYFDPRVRRSVQAEVGLDLRLELRA